MQEFKDRLKELREEQALSMKELGMKIGVSDAAVCKWENGISEPKITYVLRLAALFECSTDYLLGVTDDFVYSDYYGKKVNNTDENAFAMDRSVSRGSGVLFDRSDDEAEADGKQKIEYFKRKYR